MIFQFVLVSLLVACIVYVVTQRHTSRPLSALIVLMSCIGILFVVLPDLTNQIAAAVGVGRGADLVFYLWIVISFALVINMQLKLISVGQHITNLARAIALLEARLKKSD